MTSELFEKFWQVLEIGLTFYGTLLLKEWFDRRRERRKDDVGQDIVRKRKMTEILDRLRIDLGASRVILWLFSNGDTTLNGYHLKKMSIFAESSLEDSIAPEFQLVPTSQFERSLHLLHESEDGYFLRHESDYADSQAALADKYDIDTVLTLKVKTDTGRWIGILSVCYDRKQNLEEGEIALAQIQAAILGSIK